MKRYSSEEKAMWMEDWRTSGKSAWTYARENGILPQTFVNWTKPRERKQQPLVEVTMPIIQTAVKEPQVIIEKGDVRIHIPLEPILVELHKAIARMGQALC